MKRFELKELNRKMKPLYKCKKYEVSQQDIENARKVMTSIYCEYNFSFTTLAYRYRNLVYNKQAFTNFQAFIIGILSGAISGIMLATSTDVNVNVRRLIFNITVVSIVGGMLFGAFYFLIERHWRNEQTLMKQFLEPFELELIKKKLQNNFGFNIEGQECNPLLEKDEKTERIIIAVHKPKSLKRKCWNYARKRG